MPTLHVPAVHPGKIESLTLGVAGYRPDAAGVGEVAPDLVRQFQHSFILPPGRERPQPDAAEILFQKRTGWSKWQLTR